MPSGFCDSAGPTSAWYECDAAAPGNVVVYAYSKVGNCTGKWDKKIHNTTRYARNYIFHLFVSSGFSGVDLMSIRGAPSSFCSPQCYTDGFGGVSLICTPPPADAEPGVGYVQGTTLASCVHLPIWKILRVDTVLDLSWNRDAYLCCFFGVLWRFCFAGVRYLSNDCSGADDGVALDYIVRCVDDDDLYK